MSESGQVYLWNADSASSRTSDSGGVDLCTGHDVLPQLLARNKEVQGMQA